ncbi:MAG: Fur family transcriptional regulator [Nitrospinota bacterium]
MMAAPGRAEAFPSRDHDHGHCIADALLRAEEICARKGARLTRIRRSVLAFVWESHAPVGAYGILERLNAEGGRSAPITVYRALDFLMSCGLVHRLASLNAYTGCGVPGQPHGAHFLICTDCGAAAELHDPEIDRAILRGAEEAGFSVKAPVVEVQGQCPGCREGAAG